MKIYVSLGYCTFSSVDITNPIDYQGRVTLNERKQANLQSTLVAFLENYAFVCGWLWIHTQLMILSDCDYDDTRIVREVGWMPAAGNTATKRKAK